MDLDRRGFYEYHAAMMEPWDGPAAVCFTDGKQIGATLDRNGLRPCRYQVTTDDLAVLASEAGVLPYDAKDIRQKGRLQPGRMFLVDTVQGRIIDDEEIKAEIVRRKPYRAWVTQYRVSLDELPEPLNVPQPDHPTLRQRQQAFGYTVEELKMVVTPMVMAGEEPVSSMGTDTPLAVLSERPQLLFKYFKQLFAQVTNPPIDPIREELVMSLVTNIGPKPNVMAETPEACRRIKVQQPILTNADLEKIRQIADPNFKSKTLRLLFRVPEGPDAATAQTKFIKAINKGLLKIFSKMGISTVQSYCGAQIFEAIGLNHELVDGYFTGTASRIEGIGIREIGEETLRRHKVAYEPAPIRQLDFGGEVHYRVQGEHHNWNPETIYKLQHAAQANDPKTYKEFAALVNDESKRRSNIRGLLEIKTLPQPIPLEEVEPAKEIVKRFTTGAMSFGAISKEAHETLAIAMNRIDGKSNTGEGGEDPERFVPLPNGDSKNSAIKQVASARFGVTTDYLVHAKELQIKMAQGAKPGEGGQLPGHKAD